jgi:hypothetical protein
VKPSVVGHGGGKYCSYGCANTSRTRKIKCVCQTCSKEFFVKPSDIKCGKGKHCSKECANKSRSKKEKRICETCGKEFEAYPCNIKRGGDKYCSIDCYHESTRGEKSIHWKGGDKIHICETCGKEFVVTYSKDKDGWGKYCSLECLSAGYSEKNKGESNPNWRGGKIKNICEQCGKEFYVNQYKTKTGLGKYCSKKCKDISCIGEGSPFWKGGTTYLPYCSKFNKRRRKAVREFFNYKCLMCGTDQSDSTRKLSVHHIDHNKEQGCDGKPFNLIPLCINCHARERSREEEYKKYINKILEEGFKWGIWDREEYIKKVMYPDN